MAINLPLFNEKDPSDKRLAMGGLPVRHLASKDRMDRSVMWDDGLRREDYKKLDGNPNSVYAKTTWKNHRGIPIDVFCVKDDEEISIFEIL